MTTPNNPFGNRTWDDMREFGVKHLRARFPRASEWDIEDAVGNVLVDMLDKWVYLPGSVTGDVKRNWLGAKKYMKWEAPTHLYEIVQERMEEPAYDALVAVGQYDHGEDDEYDGAEYWDHAEPSVEDLVLDKLEAEELAPKVEKMLTEVTNQEWDDWLSDYLEGKTEREVAQVRGLPKSTVHDRRRRGMRRLQELAAKYGIAA